LATLTDPRNLVEMRRNRSYPRVVKRARHNSYRVKTSHDTGRRHDRPTVIELPNKAHTRLGYQLTA
jgi:hypothetical protein